MRGLPLSIFKKASDLSKKRHTYLKNMTFFVGQKSRTRQRSGRLFYITPLTGSVFGVFVLPQMVAQPLEGLFTDIVLDLTSIL